jgi:2-polyprenyl-3-methyl-5-hydroxy-6-metoxy-1,4-benzoquinol methylase
MTTTTEPAVRDADDADDADARSVTDIDPAGVEQFANQLIGDLGAAMSAVLVHIGDRLGLYRALGDAVAVTAAELAAKTGLNDRYVSEWLHNQAAAGWIQYRPEHDSFRLPPEHALLLSDENAPTFMAGGFDFVAAAWADENVLAESFRTGAGISWHQHDPRLFSGVERFYRPGYQANLTTSWLPALDGVVERLDRGIAVADVGCGHGAATIQMGLAYPNSTFIGFDYHDGSIAAARRRAADAGADGNVTFEVADAADFLGSYDLICLFDCLHDMGDPVASARRIRAALRPGGSLMVVEPAASEHPEDNHHPLGRLFYACSTAICVPSSLAQHGSQGLGNQSGTPRIIEVLQQAGFAATKIAATTPVNVILDARP